MGIELYARKTNSFFLALEKRIPLLAKPRQLAALFFLMIALFQNWAEILFSLLKGKSCEMRMRNNIIFQAAKKETAVPVIAEIWIQKIYGDLKEFAHFPMPTIIDIGAHIGAFTLLALWVLPRAKVFSFEPDPTNYEYLKKNVERNNFASRCRPVNKAVMKDRASRTLYSPATHSPSSTLFPPMGVRGDFSQTQVECLTLADIFDVFKIDLCDLLKIDCQGGEYEILMNTPEAYLLKIKSIVLEYHVNIQNYSPDTLVAFLEKEGYKVSRHRPTRTLYARRA